MAHNPAGHFHHGGNFGAYVYPDDYFDDCDHNHGDTEQYEHDLHLAGGHLFEHIGTFNIRSDHDWSVFHHVIERFGANNLDGYRFHDGLVVHRRVSSDR